MSVVYTNLQYKKGVKNANRAKVLRDQATKPAKARLGTRSARDRLGGGMAGKTRQRSRTRTPSTEMMSDQEELNARAVNPRSAAEVERASRCFLRNLNKQKRRDEEERGEDGEEEEDKASETDYE